MAGDTYSFIVDSFEEKNSGRYSITAENSSGKATCSAEVALEGIDFSFAIDNDDLPITESFYTEEIITKTTSGGEVINETKIIKSSSKSGSSESKCIETILPQMRDMSSQSQIMDTKETGIQIQTDHMDKGSQIEVIRSVRDESSQWKSPEVEIERITNVVRESAPFATTEESRFASSNVDENSVSQSYSYMHKSYSFNSAAGGAGAAASTIGAETKTTSGHDFSTTLIKDVHPRHYEPIELIINRDSSMCSAMHTNAACNCSSSYIDSCCFHHRPLHRFEPINLIVHKCRSGSLPPLISRINFRSSAKSDFEHTDTEDDTSYYYYADRSSFDKENYYYSNNESKMHYYKEIERQARKPAFKPVELVLDASSLSDSGKRYRDHSLPTSKRIRVPKNQNLFTSSFVYDNNSNYQYYDYDYDFDSSSDFISDRGTENKFKYASYKSSFSTMDQKQVKGETKYPTMEMTIDLKAPPTVDVPLRNINVTEGHSAKLECVVNGKYGGFLFYFVYIGFFLIVEA